MKKIIRTASLAALVAVSSMSVANAEPFKGTYIGAQAGWQHNHVKSNIRGLKIKNGQDDFLWGANIGMSTVSANGVFMAGEVNFDFTTGGHDTVFTPGLTAKLGYRFSPNFVLAAKAGVTYNSYRFKALGYTSHRKSRFGFVPGVEALYSVNEHNIIGLSYQYTFHNNIHFGGVKVKPTSHAVTAKYAYKF